MLQKNGSASLLKPLFPRNQLLAFCLGILLISACSKEEVQERTVVRPVKFFTVGAATGNFTLKYPGRVEAAQTIELAFEVPGRITSPPFVAGSLLQEGDLIAELDARDYTAQRNAAQSELTAAQNQLVRIEELREDNFASQSELDEARRRVEVLGSQLEQAEKAVEDTRLLAQFSGRLARKQIEDYANVRAKQIIGELQDISTMRITINVPENDFNYTVSSSTSTRDGSNLSFEAVISAFPDRVFPARMYEISTRADEQTGTYKLTIEFDPPDDILILPGMTSTVTISPASASAEVRMPEQIYIPSNAVVSDADGNAMVWIINQNTMKAEKRLVTVGRINGSNIVIENGIEADEIIAVSGVHALRDGMAVSEYQQ